MKRILGMAAVIAMVAACADETTTEETVDLPPADPVDGSTLIPGGADVGDLGAVSFNGTDTLTVTIPLDADTDSASYAAAGASGDGLSPVAPGTYVRFTQQDEPSDRFYTAFAKTSDDGSITGVVVSDGGQFNRFFGGARVVQNNYSAPSTGLVSYAGEYVGLLNFGTVETGAPPVPGVQPTRSAEVSGTVFLNADFNSGGKVNGAIYDRRTTLSGDFATLEDIILVPGDINADGSFEGGVEMTDVDLTPVGRYGGIFGGDNASTVGGVIDLEPGFLEIVQGDGTLTDDRGGGFENEYGIFVLNQCPGGGAPAECFDSEGPNDP